MVMLDTNILVYAIRHPGDAINDVLAEHVANDLCISSMTKRKQSRGCCHKSSRISIPSKPLPPLRCSDSKR